MCDCKRVRCTVRMDQPARTSEELREFYSLFKPGNLFILHQRERAVLKCLRRAGVDHASIAAIPFPGHSFHPGRRHCTAHQDCRLRHGDTKHPLHLAPPPGRQAPGCGRNASSAKTWGVHSLVRFPVQQSPQSARPGCDEERDRTGSLSRRARLVPANGPASSARAAPCSTVASGG